MSTLTIDQVKRKCELQAQERFPTTVKVTRDLYDDFKIMGVKSGVTFQVLVDKCLYRYVTDKKFRKEIDNYSDPNIADPTAYERTEPDKPTLSTSGPFSIS